MRPPRRKRHRPPYPNLPENLPEQLIKLFEKDDQSEEFLEIVQAIGKPSSRYEIRNHRFYDFDHCGLALIYNQHTKRFESVSFMFDTVSNRLGQVSRYQGNLPAGILWSDSCLEIEAKFGVKAFRERWVQGCSSNSCTPGSKDRSYWKDYKIASVEYCLIFASEYGGLGMVSIRPFSRAET